MTPMFPTLVSRALVLCLVAAVITAGSPPPPPPPPVVYGFRWSTTHSDGMVLQADPQRSIVWGFSATAVKVCVQSKPAVASRPPPCNYSVKDGKVWFRIELTKAVLKDDASTLRFHRVMTTRRTTITLLPSMYADARHIDAVHCFTGREQHLHRQRDDAWPCTWHPDLYRNTAPDETVGHAVRRDCNASGGWGCYLPSGRSFWGRVRVLGPKQVSPLRIASHCTVHFLHPIEYFC